MSGLDPELLRAQCESLEVEVTPDSEGEHRLIVRADQTRALLGLLFEDAQISMRRLVDLTAIDWGGRSGRFTLVYRLHAPEANARLRVQTAVDGDEPAVDSVVSLWPAAGWLEREVFDLFGIRFRGHPDLRRILLPDEFDGAPLRKDYPRQPDLALPKEIER